MRSLNLDHISHILERIVTPPAYIVIVGWAVRSVWMGEYESATLTIPIILILMVLFDLRKQIRRELPIRRVRNFGETHQFIQESLERQLRRQKPIEVRILGQTLQSYIAFLKPLLTDSMSRYRQAQISIRIAMIDPDTDHLGPGLPQAARAALEELNAYRLLIREQFSNCSLDVFTYKAPPAITGIAINDACLFLGMIRYKKQVGSSASFEMATTTSPVGGLTPTVPVYEMVRAAGGSYDIYRDTQPEDEERISLFIDSFDALCVRSTKAH